MRPTVGQVLKVGKIWGTITKVSRRSCAVRLVTGEVVEIDVRTLPPGAAFDAPEDTAKPDVRQQQRHVVFSDYSQEANTFASTTLGETSICSRAELRLGVVVLPTLLTNALSPLPSYMQGQYRRHLGST